MRIKHLLFLLFAILLAGCQLSPDTPTAHPPATRTVPTSVPTAPAATTTPAWTPIPDLQVLRAQTQAARTATFQSFTQEAYAQETKNAENSATLHAQSVFTETSVVGSLLTTITPRISSSYRSPDGKWLAQIIQYDCTQVLEPGNWPDAYEIFRVAEKEIETQLFSCGGQGAYGFAGKFWTANSRYFYYTNAREGWPDGGYPWRRPISRFDTRNGKSEILGNAVFSPGQTRLAGNQGLDLVIWDISNDTERRFSSLPANHPPHGIVWAAWSPDGRRLAYVTYTFCPEGFPCPATLFLIDTQTWQQTQLLGPSDPPMMMVEWKRPNTLSLWGADFQSTWLFDLKTKKLTQVLPTPTPTLRPTRNPKP